MEVGVLENSDAEIVDYDVLDDDCEVSDENLSLELGARTSTDEESIGDSDLSDISDAFELPIDYEGSNCDASDFDVESVSDNGQDWDYFEGNDNLWENKERQELFRSRLSQRAVETNVPRSSVDKLLSVLRTEKDFSFLPKSYKTLLKTKRKVNTIEVNPGRYYAFNVLNVIKSSLASIDVHFESPEVVLKMYVGIDELPSSKSTNSQFWPILGRLKLAGACVFPMGFYHGKSKPENANDCLHHFFSEISELIEGGFQYNGSLIKIEIEAFCCDAPALSFIKCVKTCGGYFGCMNLDF